MIRKSSQAGKFEEFGNQGTNDRGPVSEAYDTLGRMSSVDVREWKNNRRGGGLVSIEPTIQLVQ